MTREFPEIHFRGELRPSQAEVVEIARKQIAGGSRRLHVVAPPGSGKTILGLYLWAHLIRRPAVVLSPNSAIQAQWAKRTNLFALPSDLSNPPVRMDSEEPALLTSLTYQSITLPGSGSESLSQRAHELWIARLIEEDQARDPDEARRWIDDLSLHNPDYFRERDAFYRKQARDETGRSGQSIKHLHASARRSLDRLKQAGTGLLILDECHHLVGHWGRVLSELTDWLGQPFVLALTATPPDRKGRNSQDLERYDELLGPCDYEVPVPAVVKDGFLAPYQDLAYFVRPTAPELEYIANADRRLLDLVKQLEKPETPTGDVVSAETDSGPEGQFGPPTGRLQNWVWKALDLRTLGSKTHPMWLAFERRDPAFADAARRFLQLRGCPLPKNVPPIELSLYETEELELSQQVVLLDRFIRHSLRRSKQPADRDLAERLIDRMRLLGYQVTETGCRPCATPVSRILAYGRGKLTALTDILIAEKTILGERIRAVVIADFERSSSTSAKVSDLLDDEAGGAVAAFRHLLSNPQTDSLDPILVTGSSVLVDDDIWPVIEQAATEWINRNNADVELVNHLEDGFHVLNGRGPGWCPRVYVAMITELFQSGLCRCLVGTRGLLGEGWDANRINVLIDLTTVTTSMSVNQLRGRSIRLDPEDGKKLADNWDVICIAPEFLRGFDDYRRFIAKHETIFGVTDDGVIEKGVGHVHAAFTELKPEDIEATVNLLNEEMLSRAGQREAVRELWKIGQPYRAEPVRTVEFRLKQEMPQFPAGGESRTPWSSQSLAIAVGSAILCTMQDLNLVDHRPEIHASDRAGGYVRLFLESANQQDQSVFCQCLREALGPLHSPRYVIDRQMDTISETLLSRILPGFLGDYFVRRKRELAMLHAVPSLFARNRSSVSVFEKHWNALVSPGEAVFALRSKGQALIESARRAGRLPGMPTHEKEIFLS